MRRNYQRLRLAMDGDRHAHGSRFRMNERDEPCWRRPLVIAVAGALACGGIALPRDTDVPEPAEVANDLVQPRIRVRRLVQAGNDRLHEFARQPYDALILGPNTGARLNHQPRDIDGQTE